MHQQSNDSPNTVAELRSKSLYSKFLEEMKLQATNEEKQTLKTQYGFRDEHNPLLDSKLSLDMYRLVLIIKIY